MAHIAIFGRRNTGKSTILNTLTGQDIAIVSDTPGTTTDPVKKAMELPGIGAVTLIDTAGIDDQGDLGRLRVEKSTQSISKIDLALLVFTHNLWSDPEDALVAQFKQYRIPFILIHGQSDLEPLSIVMSSWIQGRLGQEVFSFSCYQKLDAIKLSALIGATLPKIAEAPRPLLEGLIQAQDVLLMVTPIDQAAPTGRMILPQVQTLRSALDLDAIVVDCKPDQVRHTLGLLKGAPRLVVTDSQAFDQVAHQLDASQALTSFSILLASQRGPFEAYLEGTSMLGKLVSGDRILILESCTHHQTCEDIGRVKLPQAIERYSGQKLSFDFISGLDPLPADPLVYRMVIQCGACMVTPAQVRRRLESLIHQGIAVSNYGMALAFCAGIFQRAVAPLRARKA